MNAISPPHHVRAGSREWQHVGEVADGVLRCIGLRAIRFHLNRAAGSGGCEALAHFREADGIRRQLRLSWNQVVHVDDDASAREAA